ncbi:MAG TPA: RDD family protein [Candidatus Polarisedimenticolaceae bacterium]|nr:RDD family protein [Candidatus Polarisedimenticolaceae bacterium]
MVREAGSARFGPRLLAQLADALLVFVPAVLVATFLPEGLYRDEESYVLLGASIAWILLRPLQWTLLIRNGETVGKRLLGLRIARPDGTAASPWQLLLLRPLPLAIVVVVLFSGDYGFLFAPFLLLADVMVRKDGRCLHDLLAGTMVIDRHDEQPLRIGSIA